VTFDDRVAAGRQLATILNDLRDQDPVVLGLPRGGVVVAAEVARALGAPLDAIMVRKLGVPVQPELAMGAIGEDGVRIVAEDVMRRAGIGADQLQAVERRERAELERRARLFRGDGHRLALGGRTAIVVDDGIATGSTAYAACRVARAQGAARVVLAVPVGSPEAVAALAAVADDVRCLETPAWLGAIGQFYRNFSQVDDDKVVALLRERPPPAAREPAPPVTREQAPPAAGDQPPTVTREQPPPAAGDQPTPVTREQAPPAAGDQPPPVTREQAPPAAGDQPPL
jgi:putative phosphoribosyl transferase